MIYSDQYYCKLYTCEGKRTPSRGGIFQVAYYPFHRPVPEASYLPIIITSQPP